MKSLDALQAFVEKETNRKPEKQPPDEVAMRGMGYVDQLLEAFQDTLNKRNKTLVKKKRTYFTPNTNNMCARYWGYMFQGVEYYESFVPRTYRIFDNGHAVHDRIVGYLQEAGIVSAVELKVSKDDPVSLFGYIDAIITIDGEEFVVEIKSISQEGFVWRETQNKPTDDHMRQTQLYLDMSGIDKGFVIYENKNTQEILPIYIEKDQELLDKYCKRYKKIEKTIEEARNVEDGLPQRPYKRTSKHCANCSLEDVCWGDKVQIEPKEEPF